MFCQNCGKKMPNDSMFCPECGTKQEAETEVKQAVQNGPSKYCSNCGAKMPADSRFCPECRTRQEDVGELPRIKQTNNIKSKNVTMENLSPEEQEKIKKRNKIIGLSFAIAIGICVIIGIISSVIKPSINLNKYLTITFEGYDTVGKAVVKFDNEQFEKDYEKKLSAISKKKSPRLSKYKSEEVYMDALFESYDTRTASGKFLSNCVSGAIEKTSGLSNGDVVTYTWECDDEYALSTYGYKLKYEDVKYTVEGLEEAEAFDPFEGIEIVFSGIAPNGSASIEGEPKANAAKDLRFDLDNYDGLSVGDTVMVTASMYYDDPVEYCIENYGMIPSPLTKQYKVEGLDSYVSSNSEISTDSLDEMKQQAEDVFNAHVADNWGEDETLKSFAYIGNYLLTNKNNDDYWNSHNVLYLVYKAQVKDEYSNGVERYNETNDIYWYIAYYDLLVNTDGITTVEISNYRTPGDRFTIDSGINSVWWSTKSWYYYGYQTLDELYQTVVTRNSDTYNHEDSVDESVAEYVTEDEEDEDFIVGEDGIIFPNSSEEVIGSAEIESLTDEELRYAINELYAKHGYIFKDDELKAYYEKYNWYDPSIKSDDFSMDMFNDVEKENVETMQKERDSRN